MFSEYLDRWNLTPDGEPITTGTGGLLPVRRGSEIAMLKIAAVPEERLGARLMVWWNGQGAARVLESAGDALLLERAEGALSLADLSRQGRDDEAIAILCTAVARLHEPRPMPLPDLVPLPRWFASLAPTAVAHGGDLRRSASVAAELLAAPQDVTVLHGDIHHGNVLDFGTRGWLAIDPKGLIGERGFDYANIFCNPDQTAAAEPGRFARRLDLVAEHSGLDRARLLDWIIAWAGLSAAWTLEDGDPADRILRVLQIAVAAS